MSIQSLLNELEEIDQEIKNNNLRNKTLRTRANEIKMNIQTYLNNKEQPGIKYKGKAILLETKEKRMPKKKNVKEKDGISYLESLGVPNPKEAYEKFLEIQKGQVFQEQGIKIKTISS